MKITCKRKDDIFQPIILEITLESKGEIDTLWHLVGCWGNTKNCAIKKDVESMANKIKNKISYIFQL